MVSEVFNMLGIREFTVRLQSHFIDMVDQDRMSNQR